MNTHHSFEKVIIRYDTGSIPPPFCHNYSITIQKDEDGKYSAALNLEYHDRDELTEEEIYDEGFTLDDDYRWEGILPDIWGEVIKNQLSGSNWVKKQEKGFGDTSISIKVFLEGKSELLKPADPKIWEMLAQDIIQAIFELGEKEAPLNLQFASVDENSLASKIDLNYRFANRTVTVTSSHGESQKINWKEGQKLLQYIFFFDFLPEDSIEIISKKQGAYIQPGDGLWYRIEENQKGEVGFKKQKLVKTLKSYM